MSNDGPSREDYVQNLQSNRATATQVKDFKPISSADFDQNFEPINAQYPSSASTSYVVNNGDTLQSIALSVWGDASMWYMLADVNGLSATDKLTAGQVLTVPNKVTNIHNNSETFRPYNPGEAIGNTQPTVPSPPPPPKPKKKCGGIAQIVMIVVAVVATIFTAGAALSVLAPGMSLFAGGLSVLAGTSSLGITGSMALAAGAAAVGSAASQLAGKAMGVVDSFSWSQVGISALTAAATAGVGGALAPAAGTAGATATQTGATATQSSWASAAKTAINNGGWVAKGAVYGTVNYGSTYLANQVFGNNQSFSWAALGSSIAGSIVAAGMGAKEVFERLGKAASPYASSLVSANAVAVIDDKWFGGAKPDYLNVSMAAITSATVRQFGENSSSSQYKSNITVYNPATGERTALDETQALYAFDIDGTIDKVKRRVEAGVDYMNERIDDVLELFYDHMPNNSQERQALMLAPLSTIVVKAEKEDSSVLKLFQERVQALEDWARASVPFQYSWATPTINTGHPRLDRYYYQPVNNLFNTIANIGWNALKLVGNTAAIVSNSPVALFSAFSGDYEASQQFYEDAYLSNSATALSIGGLRNGLRYLGDVRELNKATVVGRTIGTSQRGSASLGLLNDIPAGSTTGEVLTASMPAPKSPGAVLRDKWGHLSQQDRQTIIYEKTEALALEELLRKQSMVRGAHYLDRHGPNNQLRDQLVSAATGLRPDGVLMVSNKGKRSTVDSTQFFSYKDMLNGGNRAERIQQFAISNERPITGYISLKYSDIVGGGFLKNTPMYGVDPMLFYRETSYANFGVDKVTGELITAFPVISKKSLGTLK
ncbi:LysM peptidoglycan-binding domain-containing protein [Acinetobacter calcoaceticus]|uniref:LysM peptidoglycan-binding domain-containing protein n=1 Tax=Acinetobacter calcoaceticus TaxID=471 RepID=UPI001E615B02|nr:LysM peptidoglycan-binding domain-containing protein [Acinetobacter calcoaceticus]UGQ28871.1 LysM peptidoglycan-binding domain-containing protein [Acinetobacter calcoaceticus]